MSDSNEISWTYTPTDPERVYLLESLGGFFEDQWLTDILYKVRVGKEATSTAAGETGYGIEPDRC